MSSEKPPGHYFVPIHCIPKTFNLIDALGNKIAYGAPADIIRNGAWFRSCFGAFNHSEETIKETPMFYHKQACSDLFFLAVRTLHGTNDAAALEFTEEKYIVRPSVNFLGRKLNRYQKLAAPQIALLAETEAVVKILDFYPSPNNRSGWILAHMLPMGSS